jgi:hypothetical protein
MAAAICIPPFALTVRYWINSPNGTPIYDSTGEPTGEYENTKFDDAMKVFFFSVGLFIAFSCGVLLVVCMVLQIGASATYINWGDRFKFVNWWISTYDTQGSYNAKLAGTHKLNQMISNAHLLHFVSITGQTGGGGGNNSSKNKSSSSSSLKDIHTNQVMLNYSLWGEAEEECGGFFWTWKGLLGSRDLFKKEGYWIHSRLFIGQCIQIVAGIFYGYYMIGATGQLADKVEGWRSMVENHHFERPLPDWVFQFVPEPWMIYRSFYPAAGVAILIMICLVLVYLPTTASTVMKLRSGQIPSLADPHFMKYRLTPDTVAYNLGNTFFALLGSASMFFALFGIVIFASIWPFTKPIANLLYAWLLGLFITIFVKVFLMKVFRMHFHRAFYRENPNGANISGLMLECWHIGVAGGVLVSRLVQFLLAAAFWIGRIDVPFLSDDVRIFGYRFDITPSNYRKDVLVHEAHRHPYIERLGAMYLMKLKVRKPY